MQCQKQIKIPEHYENTFGESGKATKHQNQKPKKEILMRYTTNLQPEFNEPLTLFSQPRLPAPPLPSTLTVFANTKKTAATKQMRPGERGGSGRNREQLKVECNV